MHGIPDLRGSNTHAHGSATLAYSLPFLFFSFLSSLNRIKLLMSATVFTGFFPPLPQCRIRIFGTGFFFGCLRPRGLGGGGEVRIRRWGRGTFPPSRGGEGEDVLTGRHRVQSASLLAYTAPRGMFLIEIAGFIHRVPILNGSREWD